MNKKAIVVSAILLLLCFYTVSPALAESTGTVRIIDRDGNERSNNLDIDGSTKSSGSSSAKVSDDDDKEEEKESEDSTYFDKLNPMTTGKKMVAEGFMYFLELLGDEGFKVGTNETQDVLSVKENYGNTVARVYLMATIEFDPFENEFIQEMQLRFAIIGLFLLILFLILGAVDVNLHATLLKKNEERAYILSNRYRIPLNEYTLTIVENCLMVSFGYVFLRLTIMAELLFTKLIMIQILDRIAPTGSNVVMYLMMMLCYILIGVAIGYRLLIIGAFCASYVTFIGLYGFAITREVAIAAVKYYLQVLFLRSAIVGFTVIGVGIISTVHLAIDTTTLGSTLMTGIGEVLLMFIIQPLMYTALILILVILCLVVIVGLKNVMTASRYAVRRYTFRGR